MYVVGIVHEKVGMSQNEAKIAKRGEKSTKRKNEEVDIFHVCQSPQGHGTRHGPL